MGMRRPVDVVLPASPRTVRSTSSWRPIQRRVPEMARRGPSSGVRTGRNDARRGGVDRRPASSSEAASRTSSGPMSSDWSLKSNCLVAPRTSSSAASATVVSPALVLVPGDVADLRSSRRNLGVGVPRSSRSAAAMTGDHASAPRLGVAAFASSTRLPATLVAVTTMLDAPRRASATSPRFRATGSLWRRRVVIVSSASASSSATTLRSRTRFSLPSARRRASHVLSSQSEQMAFISSSPKRSGSVMARANSSREITASPSRSSR
mmetsp:Transcript_10116/g.41044  ORF Transcript_10116/g.41044 Transcript_10116/m.41044 type:complete len:265 (-) Transcript_10116:246-1040(-)